MGKGENSRGGSTKTSAIRCFPSSASNIREGMVKDEIACFLKLPA